MSLEHRERKISRVARVILEGTMGYMNWVLKFIENLFAWMTALSPVFSALTHVPLLSTLHTAPALLDQTMSLFCSHLCTGSPWSSWSPCFPLCWFPCGQAYMSCLICSWLGWTRFRLQQSLQVLGFYDSISLWSFFLKDLGKNSKGWTRRIKTHYCIFFQNFPSKSYRLELR